MQCEDIEKAFNNLNRTTWKIMQRRGYPIHFKR